MITEAQLAAFRRAGLAERAAEALPDLRDVEIDRALPAGARLGALVRGVGNPYLFRVGALAVRVRCDPAGPPLAELLADALAAE